MPVTTKEVKTYTVSIFSDAQPDHLAATIGLLGADGATVAFLTFFLPGTPLPPNEFRADLGYPVVSYPFTALGSIVDLLRNEKPVRFTWFDYMPTRCYGAVEVLPEPIGESENQQRLLLTRDSL